MTSCVKINPRDFEYLTESDQQYLFDIEQLYLRNSGKLKHFHSLGPWHQVKSKKLNQIVERVAGPTSRPCSKGHVKGLWCVQDPDYITGPKILKYTKEIRIPTSTGDRTPESGQTTPEEGSVEQEVSRPPIVVTIKTPQKRKVKNRLPRKFQIVPKPTPWIIMEPSQKKNQISDDPPDPSYDRDLASASLPRSAATRKSTGRSRFSKASSMAESRYVCSPFATSVSYDELGDIIQRVTRPTHASKGGVDLQEKFRLVDQSDVSAHL